MVKINETGESMKKLIIVIALILIVLSLTLAGCEPQTATEENTALTDQEILTEHPDDLDSALEDLVDLEES